MQNKCKYDVQDSAEKPPQPGENYKFSPKGVQAIEGELEDGKAELCDCVHNEDVVVPYQRLHVEHKVQLCNIVQHVQAEQDEDDMGERNNCIT